MLLPFFRQVCLYVGYCDDDVVFCREYIFFEKFYWLDELFAFGVVLMGEIVFLS